MAIVKAIKTRSYFRRFQVKPRRRREGKTHYQCRRKLVRQDKWKANARKYRLIVRFTNTKVICQIAYATIRGDMMVSQATSAELPKYGVKAGLKNYAAAYATGLLIARRTLKKFGLDQTFKGKEELDGEDYHVEDEEGDERPFKAILDVGRMSTVVGHRMWGALKGAVDGGLYVPHTNRKFPGYKEPDEKGQEPEYDAEVHRERIFGLHVKEYMEILEEEDPTKYEAHFSKYIENDMTADTIEDMWTECHEKIRENPEHVPKEKKGITYTQDGDTMIASDGTSHQHRRKISLEERKAKVMAKIAAAQAKLLGEDEDDE